jgi:hypothetical protein
MYQGSHYESVKGLGISDILFRLEKHLNFSENWEVFERLVLSCIFLSKSMHFGQLTEDSY